MTIVSDEMVQNAFDWLNEHAETAAAARAEKIRAEYNVKRVRARLFLMASGTIAERDAVAICDDDFKAATDREADAAEKDKWHYEYRENCSAMIDAWRTEQSNLRSMGRVAA